MPSLFRFLTILAVLGALGWGLVYGLAFGVRPTPREIVVPVELPAEALVPPTPAPEPPSASKPAS
jgi:hypothetical protein